MSAWAWALAILGAAAIVAFGLARERRRERAARAAAEAHYRPTGILTETSEATVAGNVARAALVLTNVGFLALVASGAAGFSAVQEAAVGTVWIALNVALGVGVVVGRRSTFVLRERKDSES